MKLDRANLALAAGICVLVALDGFNSSLSATIRPYLMGAFASSSDELAWAPIGYFTAKLVAFLLAFRLVGVFGERALMLGSAMLFVAATACAGLTSSLGAFMVCQFLQGASGGLLLAVGQGVLLRLYPSRAASIAQAFFATAVLVCPVTMAPVTLGGAAYLYEWSLVMLSAAFVGAFAWGAMFVSRESLTAQRGATDLPVPRILLLLVAIGCLVYALLEGARYAWFQSPGIVSSLVVGLATLSIFVLLERRAARRLFDYECFQLADFTFGTSVSLLAGVVLFGSNIAIAMLATGSLGYTALESGLLQLGAAPFTLAALFLAACLLRSTRIPPPLLLVTGVALLAFGMWRLGFIHPAVPREHLLPSIALRGGGLGLLLLTLTMVTLGKLPAGREVAGAGFFNFGRQLGGLVGLAWMLTLHDRLMSRNHEALASSWAINNAPFAQALAQAGDLLRGQGIAAAEASKQALALITAQFQQQTFALALNGCFQALAMMFVFALPVVVLTRIVTERKLSH